MYSYLNTLKNKVFVFVFELFEVFVFVFKYLEKYLTPSLIFSPADGGLILHMIT